MSEKLYVVMWSVDGESWEVAQETEALLPHAAAFLGPWDAEERMAQLSRAFPDWHFRLNVYTANEWVQP